MPLPNQPLRHPTSEDSTNAFRTLLRRYWSGTPARSPCTSTSIRRAEPANIRFFRAPCKYHFFWLRFRSLASGRNCFRRIPQVLITLYDVVAIYGPPEEKTITYLVPQRTFGSCMTARFLHAILTPVKGRWKGALKTRVGSTCCNVQDQFTRSTRTPNFHVRTYHWRYSPSLTPSWTNLLPPMRTTPATLNLRMRTSAARSWSAWRPLEPFCTSGPDYDKLCQRTRTIRTSASHLLEVSDPCRSHAPFRAAVPGASKCPWQIRVHGSWSSNDRFHHTGDQPSQCKLSANLMAASNSLRNFRTSLVAWSSRISSFAERTCFTQLIRSPVGILSRNWIQRSATLWLAQMQLTSLCSRPGPTICCRSRQTCTGSCTRLTSLLFVPSSARAEQSTSCQQHRAMASARRQDQCAPQHSHTPCLPKVPPERCNNGNVRLVSSWVPVPFLRLLWMPIALTAHHSSPLNVLWLVKAPGFAVTSCIVPCSMLAAPPCHLHARCTAWYAHRSTTSYLRPIYHVLVTDHKVKHPNSALQNVTEGLVVWSNKPYSHNLDILTKTQCPFPAANTYSPFWSSVRTSKHMSYAAWRSVHPLQWTNLCFSVSEQSQILHFFWSTHANLYKFSLVIAPFMAQCLMNNVPWCPPVIALSPQACSDRLPSSCVIPSICFSINLFLHPPHQLRCLRRVLRDITWPNRSTFQQGVTHCKMCPKLATACQRLPLHSKQLLTGPRNLFQNPLRTCAHSKLETGSHSTFLASTISSKSKWLGMVIRIQV